ncbi:MAG: cytochrome b N-terminal domain-containing protein, partial [Verrucomicrobiota bacterium]
ITPVIGPTIARVLRGGSDVGAPTLTRFFALHVMVLPMLTAGLLALHVVLVQKNGMSTPPWISPSHVRQMKFFPNFFLREVMVWYGALAVLGGLAAIFPWELGVKANPFASAPTGIRPEWYFLAQFYTLKLIPSHVWVFEGELLGMAGFGLLAVVWALIPVWGVNRAGQARMRLVTGAGIFLAAYLAIFTVLGYFK